MSIKKYKSFVHIKSIEAAHMVKSSLCKIADVLSFIKKIKKSSLYTQDCYICLWAFFLFFFYSSLWEKHDWSVGGQNPTDKSHREGERSELILCLEVVLMVQSCSYCQITQAF